MSIQEIKSRLSIMWVLNHYGLKTDSNGMLPCPFHDDQESEHENLPQEPIPPIALPAVVKSNRWM